MLVEIRCGAFGEVKQVPFSSGLNVIQGVSGNSIGKSNMLKIIDYAFGGKYYSDSNEDVRKNVGEHEICYAHAFDGETFYFKRSAKSHRKVERCKDNTYIPFAEMTDKEFSQWLSEKYKFQDLGLTFREMVGLYSRIWNKPNKEVNRPLYNHNSQNVSTAITSLVKLFDEYSTIKEMHEETEYLTKRSRIVQNAVSYNVVKMPTAKEYKALSQEFSDNTSKISELKMLVSASSVDNFDQIEAEKDGLFDKRVHLIERKSRITRKLKKYEKDIKQLNAVDSTTFSSIEEFFPEINMERLKEVQSFHSSLRGILLSEIKEEEEKLKQEINDIAEAIENIEKEIEKLTRCPIRVSTAMDELLALAKKQEKIQEQITLYEDKTAEAKQLKENKEQLEASFRNILPVIQAKINDKIKSFSCSIESGNSKPPVLSLSAKDYQYGVKDNTGTGKAYTDLILFDLAILALTELPIIIHDSFLFNNIDDQTKQSFLKLYNRFPEKQVFISLDTFLGNDNKEIDELLYSSTRLVLSENSPLYGKDWRI